MGAASTVPPMTARSFIRAAAAEEDLLGARLDHTGESSRVGNRQRAWPGRRPTDSLRPMDRKTVVLGIAAAVAVGAAVTLTLVGRSGTPKHNAVARYITDIDQVQQQMRTQLTNTVKAYRAFASGGTPAQKLRPQLVQAERTLQRLRRRLVALPAPEPAKHLRALLLRLTGADVSIAHEIGQRPLVAPGAARDRLAHRDRERVACSRDREPAERPGHDHRHARLSPAAPAHARRRTRRSRPRPAWTVTVPSH